MNEDTRIIMELLKERGELLDKVKGLEVEVNDLENELYELPNRLEYEDLD